MVQGSNVLAVLGEDESPHRVTNHELDVASMVMAAEPLVLADEVTDDDLNFVHAASPVTPNPVVPPLELEPQRTGADSGAYVDTDLTCFGCNAVFTWTAAQQEFFVLRGLTTRPQRCKECNKQRTYLP
jgi:hypothetical protein